MHGDLQFLRTRANYIRFSYIEQMENHLLAFESKMTSKNFKVRWINEEQEMVEFISNTMTKNNYNKVCFDIKTIPEQFFEKKNYIKQISIEEVENNKDTAENLVIEADFGIVENGSIIFLNKLSKNCFNNVEKLFIILDISKLVVKQNDLEILLYLQKGIENMLFYDDIKIISAPPSRIITKNIQISNEENYTSENIEVYVLLYDTDVIEILEDNMLRETLYCINCGKCKEVCPVYQQTKQFSPIELVKYHCKERNKRMPKIFENTTLCGNCNEVCPVQINFTQLLIQQMQKLPKRAQHEQNIDLFKVFSKRAKMNKVNSKIRRYFFVNKYYGKNKKLANYFSKCKDEFYNLIQKKSNY